MAPPKMKGVRLNTLYRPTSPRAKYQARELLATAVGATIDQLATAVDSDGCLANGAVVTVPLVFPQLDTVGTRRVLAALTEVRLSLQRDAARRLAKLEPTTETDKETDNA